MPTLRNLNDSFESWAYRNGFDRQLRRLADQRMIERDRSPGTRRICRLTEKGRLHALGGRDPDALWSQDWDGFWRIIVFDIPVQHNGARVHLRRRLRSECFGLLQKSVWVTPRPLSSAIRKLCGKGDDVGTVLSIAGRPCSGEPDAAIVERSWDYDEVNRRYQHLSQILDRLPIGALNTDHARFALRHWGEAERFAWKQVVELDPFLPRQLLPRGYVGRKIWKKRKEIFCEVARRLT